MGGNLKVQIVRHEGIKLHPQQAALCQHTAVLLDEVTEVLLESRAPNHHRFAKQGAHLGAADVEHIAQPGDIRKGQVITLRHQAVAQPRAVQEQVQSQLPAGFR